MKVRFLCFAAGLLVGAGVALSATPSQPPADESKSDAAQTDAGQTGDVQADPAETDADTPARPQEAEDAGVHIDPIPRHARKVIRIPDPKRRSPEQEMYVPPKFRKLVVPVYPYPLLRDGVNGTAKVICMVDDEGAVTSTRVMAATRPEFAAALVAALEASDFASATKAGEPISTVLGYEHTFSSKKNIPAPLRDDLRLVVRETKQPGTIARASRLDAPLKPLEQPVPAFPIELVRRGLGGDAVIEFLLDEQGLARLPRIVSATDPAFGYAAVQAVARWKFRPATAGGQPALLRVRVPFRFIAPSRNPFDASS